MPVLVVEDADLAAFGGNVDPAGVRVIDQHVGRFSDTVVVDHGSVDQIDSDHCGVVFAADKHHLVGDVECLAVRMIATGRRNALSHSGTDRVNDGELIAALHRDHHPVKERVVDNVSDLTAQRYSRADCAGVGVDHGLGTRALVGRPHGAPDRVVSQTVGIGVGRSAEHNLAGVFVDGGQLVVAGGGRVYATLAGHDDHAMHVRQI